MTSSRTTIGLLAVLLLLAACNTVEGMGKDIRSAGDAITGGARKTKEEIR